MALGVTATTGCSRKVEVQTGEKVVCTYGHPVTDTVETVEVRAKDAALYTVDTRTITCETHLKAERLYKEAQDALAAKDTKTAAAKLAEVAKLDPGFGKTAQQQADIAAGNKPKPDTDKPTSSSGTPAGETGGETGSETGSGGQSPKPGDEAEVTGPAASLMGWMPDAIGGYTAEKAKADAMYVSRDYVSTTDKGAILVISAEQVISEKAANERVASDVKALYQSDKETFRQGAHEVYIGTDGRHVAVLGLSDGPVVVLMQISSNDLDAAELKARLKTVAQGVIK